LNREPGQRGQALLELAIFGSIALLALGALINYGLNADFTQQAMMESFRRALFSAAEAPNPGTPASVSYVQLTDRHIPNPSHPFMIGSVVPVMGQANAVVRNFQTQETADTEAELPRTRITVQEGVEVDCPSAGSGCTTAGFRSEAINDGNKEKYQEIYGADNVDQDGQRVIDICDGEIIDFDACVRQARQIISPPFCQQECERGRSPGSTVDCAAICSQTIGTPWYAQGGFEQNGIWVFPALNNLFAGIRSMGIQPGYDKRTTVDATLAKSEDSGVSRTVSSVAWRDNTDRTFVHRSLGNAGATAAGVKTRPKNQNSTAVWTTPWN